MLFRLGGRYARNTHVYRRKLRVYVRDRLRVSIRTSINAKELAKCFAPPFHTSSRLFADTRYYAT